jgi:hypothetical protein
MTAKGGASREEGVRRVPLAREVPCQFPGAQSVAGDVKATVGAGLREALLQIPSPRSGHEGCDEFRSGGATERGRSGRSLRTSHFLEHLGHLISLFLGARACASSKGEKRRPIHVSKYVTRRSVGGSARIEERVSWG